MCSSYVRLVSKITPRSLEVCSGTLSSHHESGAGSDQFGMRLSATKHHKFSFAWVQQQEVVGTPLTFSMQVLP